MVTVQKQHGADGGIKGPLNINQMFTITVLLPILTLPL